MAGGITQSLSISECKLCGLYTLYDNRHICLACSRFLICREGSRPAVRAQYTTKPRSPIIHIPCFLQGRERLGIYNTRQKVNILHKHENKWKKNPLKLPAMGYSISTGAWHPWECEKRENKKINCVKGEIVTP